MYDQISAHIMVGNQRLNRPILVRGAGLRARARSNQVCNGSTHRNKSAPATFVFCEVKKLSRQTTSCPCDTSLLHRCEPRKPQPPVTRMRMKGSFSPLVSAMALACRPSRRMDDESARKSVAARAVRRAARR
eukprot:6200122-Pleurochrysis_carterae.AAC.5